MRRRLGWVSAACAVALAGACGTRAPAERPNILLISVDTLRADHLGCYGYERPTSPALDRLASTSCVFDAAYSASSWTLPSMASVMTATPASIHGCSTMTTTLHPGARTLAERLHAGGYDTAAVVSHTFLGMRYGFQQGIVWFDDELVCDVPQDSHKAVTSHTVSDKGIAYLGEKADAADGAPWFLWLHYFDPHGNLVPHEGLSERFGVEDELDLYDGEIAYTDLHIGRVLDALEQSGLAESTVVLVIADHGESFEAPRDAPLEGQVTGARHGTHLYSEVIRVPLLVRVPNVVPRRIAIPVSGVDVMPTLLELAALPLAQRGRGRSLVPLLEGSELPPEPVLSELRAFNGSECDALIDGHWKLIEDLRRERVMLFNLEADPHELDDVAGAQPERRDAMLSLLRRRRAELARAAGPGALQIDLSPAERLHLKELGYVGD